MDEKIYIISSVYGRGNNQLNRDVFYDLRQVFHETIVKLAPAEVLENVRELVNRYNKRYPRCRQLSVRMTELNGAMISVDDGTGNSVCNFQMHEIKRVIKEDNIESYLF